MTLSPEPLFSGLKKSKFEIIRKLHLCYYHLTMRRLAAKGNRIHFLCNICGNHTTALECKVYSRDLPSCQHCGSNLRARAIIHVLSIALFNQSLILPDFPETPSIRGIGTSDWNGYAAPLGAKLGYTNTFYHKEPRLDLASTLPPSFTNLNFLITCDVLEHIIPPVSLAFKNIFQMLLEKGVCIITAPYMLFEKTWEHFPNLNQFTIAQEGQHKILINEGLDGRMSRYRDLIFHGGDGATLEMRIFSKSGLRKELLQAGFRQVTFHRCNKPEYGIYWPCGWSLPISAIK